MNQLTITEKEWSHLSESQKIWILYRSLQALTTRVENLRPWSKTLSFMGGVIGGVAGWLGLHSLN